MINILKETKMSCYSTHSSTISVDDEWEKFLNKTNEDEDDELDNYNNTCNNSYCGDDSYSTDVDETGSVIDYHDGNNETGSETNKLFHEEKYMNLGDLSNMSRLSYNVPISSNIHISTKSKISYLNREIDIKKIFWEIPIIPYEKPEIGIIKKQIKINSNNEEELKTIQEKLNKEKYYQEQIITSINNPAGRIKFKDIRKISIGMSKKDIINGRAKKKSVFYNCFVMILRLKIDNIFKEYHVKVFNTGKLEMPGVQNDNVFKEILAYIINILQPFIEEEKLLECSEKSDTILINSNFNCGFYINREELVDILKYKYNIHSIYDPTSYPGIQCKFYYDPITKTHTSAGSKELIKSKEIVEMSFMIFRTGSVLIVGMCEEYVLHIIYDFLTKILSTEYYRICQKNNGNEEIKTTIKKPKKTRKKNILVSILPSIQEVEVDEESDI